MGKKKRNKGKSSSHKKNAPKKQSVPTAVWVVGALLAGVVALVVMSNNASTDTAVPAGSPEADYIGRLLPDGYQPPQVADRDLYTQTIAMSAIGSEQADGSVSVPLSEVLAKKIVKFDYTRADGELLPLIAYVKPSGALFVGVSYCPPCEGEGQHIAADGTLTCDACGTKRDLETNAGISGACQLYPLDEIPVTVDGDVITADGAVLDAWTAQPLDRPVG
jgi:hypothetical protein